MATVYKHGTYGEFLESVARPSTQSGTIAVYVGLAPVNLVRGYEDYVNAPVLLSSFSDVKRKMGYSDDWRKFTLCEAFKAHLDNPVGNAGPIVAINVLNPETDRKTSPTTKEVTFVNKRAVINGDAIILDTLVLADKVEGKDFTVDYDFVKKQTVLTDIGAEAMGKVSATYSEIDTGKVKADLMIGGVSGSGVYSGMGCIELVYPELNLIPNVIAAPGWSQDPKVYEALVTAGTKINGHWDAYAVADLTIEGTDTIEKAIEWKNNNGYILERSKVCWPMAKDAFGNIYHGSTVCVWTMLRTDATHNGVPMETPSNKKTFVAKQYFGYSSMNRGFDQQRANVLNAEGITTFVYWGGQWVLWGSHSAAYQFGATPDPRVIFDNSMRMMMHITNSFQQEHALSIDEPMTKAMADTIKNREQEKADALVAIGALIGKPVVSFEESENSHDELVEGNFTWGFEGTPTPPFKSGTLQVAYTDDGFDSYLGGE